MRNLADNPFRRGTMPSIEPGVGGLLITTFLNRRQYPQTQPPLSPYVLSD